MTRPKIIITLIVFILLISSSLYIYSTIVKFQDIPFPWDSAGHAWEGLRIAQDLRTGDMISFLADTYSQAWWPFFHSWLLAPAFMLFGNTYTVARSVSLFCYVIFVISLYFIGMEMSGKRGHWSGLILVFLAITSSPIVILSSMSMSEVPGLMMVYLTLLFYLMAMNRQNNYLWVCTGILMAFALFTKWHHGVFVIAAVLLTKLTSDKKILSRNNYSLFIPFLIIMAVWFIYPRHVTSFYGHATFQPHYYELYSLDNWLYYPKSYVQIYHASFIVPVIIGVCFLYSLRGINDPMIRLFAINILAGIVLMTIKLDNRHRYIITLVPSIWILGSYQFVEIVHSLKNKLSNKRIKIALAIVAICVFSAISLQTITEVYGEYPGLLKKHSFYSDEKPGKAYDFISRNVDKHENIAVFGTWDYYNSLKSATIRWHIEADRADDLTRRNNKKEKAYYYFQQLVGSRDLKAYQEFIHFLENKDLKVYEYNLLSFMKNLDMKAYQDYRKKISMNPFSDKVIDVHSIKENVNCLIIIYYEKEQDVNYYAEQFLSKQDEWIKYKGGKFPDLGITIAIYERKAV